MKVLSSPSLVPRGHTGFSLVRVGSLPWRAYGTITVEALIKIDAKE